ncbi:glycosyltransferase family 4 protein [Chloroflexus aggregans]|uniref:Glycosyl transferase group 1 n=1 Tax=Chloroflexus aggregans (strain MD-66 / DSM 9485) TaxID=326427 RepID=B8GCC4_CHLAD|nr:glycosyltransferase family 4 protein [Chloroflexus aggregans]ACL24968.1 glycosyl transferase group 1 [Chloroflexus aggregans DSM 9485]
MNHVLLTVSGVIPNNIEQQIAAGRRPRADYLELARHFGADLLDYRTARATSGIVGRLFERLGGPNLMLAWACFSRRHRYQAIFTDGEQVGLPLAALLKFFSPNRRPRHLMIVHILSVPKKMIFLDRFGVHSHIDRFIVYSTWQQRFITERWQVPKQRVPFTPFMVDDQFFHPRYAPPRPTNRPQICAVGLERRDYPTLLRAVTGLNADVVVAAASPWSKQRNSTQGQPIPPNVQVQKFSQYDLRQLYSDSRFLVMPLEPVEFQAGVTAILEAMAMERAVICTRTPGQTDVVVEGETGLYVPPRDPEALRSAIERLLADPDRAARMGRAGRRLIETTMNLDHYAVRLTDILYETISETGVDLPPLQPKERL